MPKVYERDRFFDYFRDRARVARSVFPPASTLTPDQHVLVGAGLDALATYWARSFQGPASGQGRLAAFLAEHGGHAAFHRVAGAMLASAVAAKAKSTTHSGFAPFVVRISDALRLKPPPARVASWAEDPDVAAVLALPSVIAAHVPREMVEAWRYGGVIYKEHRCAWVHELNNGAVADWSPVTRPYEPHYFARNGTRTLTFSGPFLLDTYDRAIASFESQCVARGVSTLHGP